ncbi:MAG: hypothetical protein AAF802_03220 [Planctomycetota bacterium]
MNPIPALHRIIRRFRSTYRSIISFPARINLVDAVVAAFAFPQYKWVRRLRHNLADEGQDLTWQQASNPLYWVAWSFRFSKRWFATRPYMALAPAIPAMLCAGLLAATVVAVMRRDDASTQTVYLDRLRLAMQNDQVALASVAAQRLLQIDPDNQEHQYQLALLDLELGKRESAELSMLRLAVEKEYGPAALWLLQWLVYPEKSVDEMVLADAEARRQNWTEDQRRLCRRCASIAITNLSADRARLAKRLFAEFLVDGGHENDALRLYESIAETDPSVRLTAAQLASFVGDYDLAQQLAKSALTYLEPRLLAEPASVGRRLAVAQAMVLDERDEEAFELLMQGYAMTPDDQLMIAAGESLIFRAERLKRSVGQDATLLKRAQLLLDALRLAPQSPLVVHSVVALAIECGEADDDKVERVRKALLRGVSPGTMHFIEGTVLLMAGETEDARRHLELAVENGGDQQSDNIAGVFNNLAVALSQSGEEQLPQALRFAEEALQRMPTHPFMLETRGQIFLKLGRHQEAIRDLERSLSVPALRPLAHSGLAQAYEALGLSDLAEENRQLARQYGVGVGNSGVN